MIVNGTSYHNDTPQEVIDILENARLNNKRLILTYGFPNGNEWGDDEPIRGCIGRSVGTVKIPVLLKTKRSTGGEGILDHCIVKIQESIGRKCLYRKTL